MIDRHYTPGHLAVRLLDAIPNAARVRALFDPTCGEGALLKAGHRRYGPQVVRLGADTDEVALKRLRQSDPDVVVGRADIFSPRSRAASRAWSDAKLHRGLWVILNPPFSFRGGGGVRQTDSGGSGANYLSPAVAALEAVSIDLPLCEGFVCVVPEGTMHNLRDQAAWRRIRSTFDLEVVDVLEKRSFAPAIANVVLIRGVRVEASGGRRSESSDLWLSRNANRKVVEWKPPAACRCTTVVRGTMPSSVIASLGDGDSLEVVHSTHLGGSVRGRMVDEQPSTRRAVSGPAVAFPRVGPSPVGRLRVLVEGFRYLPSDCVFVVKTAAPESIDALHSFLQYHAEQLADLYLGTGARHLTTTRLRQFLTDGGFSPAVGNLSGHAPECRLQE